MSSEVMQWLQLFVRWFHVVAGVLWLGQTALFTWLDTRMRVEAGSDGEERVYLVHSGGFYEVNKKANSGDGSHPLHWFKWEAAASWASGILMLILVYYAGGALLDYDSTMGSWTAVSIGVATLAVGWLVYDVLCLSPLARSQSALSCVFVVLLVACAYGLSQVFSGRAAYIHIGALLGTVMTANVWMRILPAQRRMVAAVAAGQEPDPALGAGAKRRSQHNTFLALPLIFIMVSNHYPTASYAHEYGWLLLLGFLLIGFFARELMNRWNRRLM